MGVPLRKRERHYLNSNWVGLTVKDGQALIVTGSKGMATFFFPKTHDQCLSEQTNGHTHYHQMVTLCLSALHKHTRQNLMKISHFHNINLRADGNKGTQW